MTCRVLLVLAPLTPTIIGWVVPRRPLTPLVLRQLPGPIIITAHGPVRWAVIVVWFVVGWGGIGRVALTDAFLLLHLLLLHLLL